MLFQFQITIKIVTINNCCLFFIFIKYNSQTRRLIGNIKVVKSKKQSDLSKQKIIINFLRNRFAYEIVMFEMLLVMFEMLLVMLMHDVSDVNAYVNMMLAKALTFDGVKFFFNFSDD